MITITNLFLLISAVASTESPGALDPVNFLRLRHLLGVTGVLDFLLSTASYMVFQ